MLKRTQLVMGKKGFSSKYGWGVLNEWDQPCWPLSTAERLYIFSDQTYSIKRTVFLNNSVIFQEEIVKRPFPTAGYYSICLLAFWIPTAEQVKSSRKKQQKILQMEPNQISYRNTSSQKLQLQCWRTLRSFRTRRVTAALAGKRR